MHTRCPFFHYRLSSLVVLILLILTQAGADAQTGEQPLLWPSPPEQARIKFVRTISGPEDLGIKGGIFGSLKDLLFGRSKHRLIRPMAVLETPEGVLYVADPGSNGIHRFDLGNRTYDFIQGEGRTPLPSPVALACDRQNNIYAVDSVLRQVFVIGAKSKEAKLVSLKAKVEQPTAVALNQGGDRLYVTDTGSHQIKVFGLDGTPLATFGRRGTGDGEFNYPLALWRDGANRLLVTDSLNFRIQVFSDEGIFVAKFGQLGDATGDFSRPKGVAADRWGNIYVVDSLFHAVQIFNLSGEPLLSFGSQGHERGEFWLPTGISIGANDVIYVADSFNERIQVFQYIGKEP